MGNNENLYSVSKLSTFKILLLCISSIVINGCASIVNTAFCHHDVYGGVMLDADLIEYNYRVKDIGAVTVLTIDITLSAVADTIFLPVNALQKRNTCIL